MSVNITTAFVQQYSNNVQMLSQQKGSLLRNTVRVESVVGENAFFDQIGSVTAVTPHTRHANTPLSDSPHSRRRVSLVDYEWADLIDNQDKLRSLIDPTSSYALAAAYAIGRATDDLIIAAASGTASTGVAGATSTVLPAAQIITEAATAGLTIAKLRNAKKILDLGNVDPSISRYIVVGPNQVADLLGDTSVTSSDFNTVKALVNGEINTFMGFNFIMSNRLSIASSKRKVIAYVQDGLLLAQAGGITSRIDERADKSYSTQVYAAATMGATRMEEAKVVTIEAYEA